MLIIFFGMGKHKQYLACNFFNLQSYKYSVHLRWTYSILQCKCNYCQLEINQRANTLIKFSIIGQYSSIPLQLVPFRGYSAKASTVQSVDTYQRETRLLPWMRCFWSSCRSQRGEGPLVSWLGPRSRSGQGSKTPLAAHNPQTGTFVMSCLV